MVWTDGGGKAKAAPRPVVGACKAARFLVGVTRDLPADAAARQLILNGHPGLVITRGETVLNTVVLDINEGQICGVTS
jgi:RNA polymerase sigma-70 factor (ECF subfamily)